ncbi:putative transmembrane protein [Rhodopirellula islandica]|uniref:Transmembrane protein n=1 Tax=Rhodopirellula islandica TaxID=595434 RepID=A0A0J1BJD4_RHOIS|nr:Tad domain-containing protein [Rhodopirellula islandica]KLU06676.1 putative transmembrane protein [Rhodopirellula islandica]
MLILVVMLLFALLAIAGLLIDIGMARLTQAHMQSVSDAAAIEGGWQLAMGADKETTRDAVVRRAAEMSESWGPHRIELEDGYDLNDDGKRESSQTIKRDTLGDPVRPMLDPNVDNDIAGDIVLGEYMRGEVPDDLPGQPSGYDRSPAFEPNDEDPNSILVRLRRTGEAALAGGTSAERLTYLWSRGSLLDLSLKGDGIAVRSESIATLAPAVAIGRAFENPVGLPSANQLAFDFADWQDSGFADAFPVGSLKQLEDYDSEFEDCNPLSIGHRVTDISEVTLPDEPQFYSMFSSFEDDNGDDLDVVVGFVFARITEDEDEDEDEDEYRVEILRFVSTGKFANFTTDFDAALPTLHYDAQSTEIASQVIRFSLGKLSERNVVRAPVLVRSQQIQGGTP